MLVVPFAVLEGIGPGPVLPGPDPIAAVATRVGPGHTQIILYRALLPGCVTCPLALIGPASAGVGRDRGALAQAHGLASDGVGGAAGGILGAGARRAGEGGAARLRAGPGRAGAAACIAGGGGAARGRAGPEKRHTGERASAGGPVRRSGGAGGRGRAASNLLSRLVKITVCCS